MRQGCNVDLIARRLRDVNSAKFVLTLMREDSEKPWAPNPKKRSSKVLSEQAVASAKRIDSAEIEAVAKRHRRTGVAVQGACRAKFVPTAGADFESAEEHAEYLDYVQQLRSKYHK